MSKSWKTVNKKIIINVYDKVETDKKKKSNYEIKVEIMSHNDKFSNRPKFNFKTSIS